MEEGYEHSEENDFAHLDEWLCEYVDGTIDPIVREALEEYMQANPALASHVESLMETRHLLCNFGCKHKAPSRLQPLLRYRLENEIVQEAEPWLSRYNFSLATVAAISSIAALLLILASTTSTDSTDRIGPTRLGVSHAASSQNLQIPVWKATPAEQLNNFPIYSQFAEKGLSIAPAELRFPIMAAGTTRTDSIHTTFQSNDFAP